MKPQQPLGCEDFSKTCNAAIRLVSNGDGSFDCRIWIIPLQPKILISKLKNTLNLRIQHHSRKGTRGAGKLLSNLFKMIEVDVGVTGGVDELTGLKSADLRNHHSEKGIRGYIERNSEKNIGTALVELAGELPVRNVELKQSVARRQRHLLHFRNVPRRHNHPARIRVVLYRIYHLRQLVNRPSVGSRPTTPLMSVNRSEITIFVRPFIPYRHSVILEILYVRITGDKPQKFIND